MTTEIRNNLGNYNGVLDYNLNDSIRFQEFGTPVASYAHAIITGKNIVLASESRVVDVNENGGASFISDSCPKVTFLERSGIGCVFTGHSTINGMGITEYVRNLEVKGETVKAKLFCIASYISQDLPKDGYVRIACGGFDGQEPMLFQAKLYVGKGILIEPVKAIWHTSGTAATLFCDKQMNLDARIQDTGSLLEFSDFLVQTEIGVEKFRNRIPVVGGPIQTLLINQEGHFWIHRLGEWQL